MSWWINKPLVLERAARVLQSHSPASSGRDASKCCVYFQSHLPVCEWGLGFCPRRWAMCQRRFAGPPQQLGLSAGRGGAEGDWDVPWCPIRAGLIQAKGGGVMVHATQRRASATVLTRLVKH